LTDLEIIAEVKKGNTRAFRDIITRYEAQVAATVFAMLGRSPEAEDVGQEVFIRFYKALDNFRGEAALGTYLTRIAINLSLNELRRRKRKNHLFVAEPENEFEYKSEHNNTGDDTAEIIRKAVQKLEPKFRSVIVLRLIDGYSTEETAKILKIPLGTVLSRLARAQKKLKENLSPSWEVNYG
jgi:RNA polymerase sigma-70 factor (ECF subfamily)